MIMCGNTKCQYPFTEACVADFVLPAEASTPKSSPPLSISENDQGALLTFVNVQSDDRMLNPLQLPQTPRKDDIPSNVEYIYPDFYQIFNGRDISMDLSVSAPSGGKMNYTLEDIENLLTNEDQDFTPSGSQCTVDTDDAANWFDDLDNTFCFSYDSCDSFDPLQLDSDLGLLLKGP
ncbi:hypothetical protein DFQ28_011686 [Apophysomyces sp. BC1034]|nr:hypothetical protein DFQ28_011686 [Apophysomyces sp. BC1034]